MFPLSRLKLVRFISQRPFWLLTGLLLAGYGLAWFWFPLRPYFDQLPLADIRTFTPSLGHGLAYVGWLVTLYGLYGLAYRYVRQSGMSFWLIAGTAILFAFPLLQTYPINATDIYRYVIHGRIGSAYDQNPFVTAPEAVADDPLLPFAGEWAAETSPYGPIWEMVAGAVTAVTGDNLFWGLTAFKLLGLTAHLAIAALIWGTLADKPPGIRAGRTLLWAWNPALLLMFVVDGHNDALMLFWLLLGWWLAQRERPLAGFIVMLLAPLTKMIGLLPLPFFFIAIWLRLPDSPADSRARLRFLLLSVLGGLTIVVLAFLPFGSPLDLLIRLQREAADGASFSVGALILLAVQAAGSVITKGMMNGLALLSVSVLAVLGLLLLWLAWQKRPFLRNTADIFAAYIITALNFRLWYATWLFPWLLLDTEQDHHNSQFRLRAGIWLLLTTQLSVFIYGHLRVYVLGGNAFLSHLIGVPFTFFLPLILARHKPG